MRVRMGNVNASGYMDVFISEHKRTPKYLDLCT